MTQMNADGRREEKIHCGVIGIAVHKSESPLNEAYSSCRGYTAA